MIIALFGSKTRCRRAVRQVLLFELLDAAFGILLDGEAVLFKARESRSKRENVCVRMTIPQNRAGWSIAPWHLSHLKPLSEISSEAAPQHLSESREERRRALSEVR